MLNFNHKNAVQLRYSRISKRAFDTTWHPSLLYSVYQMQFSTSIIKLISSFLSDKKFRGLVQSKMFTLRITQRSVLSPSKYAFYIYNPPETPGVHLGPFVEATDCKEDYFLRKLQSGLTSIASCCGSWNIKSMKNQAICFFHRRRPIETLTLKGRDISFWNHIKHVGIIFERLHAETITVKTFRTVPRVYFLSKSGRLNTSIKPSMERSLGL
jgi:hypothetical protein